MNVAGVVHLSTVDWYGKAAMVIFLRGCPLRCRHCHNADYRAGNTQVELDEIAHWIETAAPFIDALVLSGGEPMMQPDSVKALVELARRNGLKVAVETSGFYPINPDMFDMVFLSVKTRLEEEAYKAWTGHPMAFSNLISNLQVLPPEKTEIRFTVFDDSDYGTEIFRIFRKYKMRFLRGNNLKQEMLCDTANYVATLLDCHIEQEGESYLVGHITQVPTLEI